MASYLWAPDSAHLLFDSNGRLWLYDLRKGTGVEVGSTGRGLGRRPQVFSRRRIDLVHSRSRAGGGAAEEPRRAHDRAGARAQCGILNGQVDWVYEEELETRSNYFWSPDSRNLAYLQMDESAVPEYPITDWIPTHATVEMQRYPQPGDPNPAVRVGVVSAQGGKTVWVNLPLRAGQDYIPRFGWVDAKTLWVETLTRDQKHRDIYFADAATGQAHPVLQLGRR
jgi:dipeptidyl-peptidase-4